MALHLACAVKPSAAGLAERDGTQTAAALLAAGADIESGVPMDADEGDFRATPVWYAAARGENLALVRVLLARGADAPRPAPPAPRRLPLRVHPAPEPGLSRTITTV